MPSMSTSHQTQFYGTMVTLSTNLYREYNQQPCAYRVDIWNPTYGDGCVNCYSTYGAAWQAYQKACNNHRFAEQQALLALPHRRTDTHHWWFDCYIQ